MVAAYLQHVALEKRLAPRTVALYAHGLQRLLALGQALAVPLCALQPQHIRRSVAQWHSQGGSSASIALGLSCWRGFFHWLAGQHRVQRNPVQGIRPPKAAQRLPKALPVVDTSQPVCCSPVAAGPIDHSGALEIALRLKALADPVRVKLVSLLFSAETGEVCGCDLAAAVGAGLVSDRDVLGAVYPGQKEEKKKGPLSGLFKSSKAKANGDAGGSLEIRGLIPGMAVHYARCCHPLPGDRIVGIVTTGKGVTIHTIDCDTLESFADAPERWLDVAWDAGSETKHIGRLRVTLVNEPGSLSSVAHLIAKDRGNISNLKIVNRGEDFFDMLIDIEVSDVKHLSHIIAALKADKSINAVERTRS